MYNDFIFFYAAEDMSEYGIEIVFTQFWDLSLREAITEATETYVKVTEVVSKNASGEVIGTLHIPAAVQALDCYGKTGYGIEWDDDGKAWHIFSSEDNSTLHVAELTDDYLDYTGRWWRAAELDWTEAVAICKKNGWYYLIGSGCTGWKPNAARSYRARSITGPWERMDNPCAGVNPVNGLGPELTWGGQSNYILKKSEDEYIAMFDIWKPENQVDSRLVWLPVTFNSDGTISIKWK
jgi:hypothetical protein